MNALRVLSVLVLLLVLPWPPGEAIAPTDEWGEGTIVAGLPEGDGRHMRVPLTVNLAGAAAMKDVPVTATVDLGQALVSGGYPADPGTGLVRGFQLDPSSVTLHEVLSTGAIVRERVPVDVFEGGGGEPFDARLNPTISIRWILDGPTQPGQPRLYYLYFDTVDHGPFASVTYADGDLDRIAAAVGPGRGTRHYVALYGLPNAQGSLAERRFVRIVAVSDASATQVEVHEYSSYGSPALGAYRPPQPLAPGQTWTYQFGDMGRQASSGILRIDSDAPVTVEAYSVSLSNSFLPSSDGGMVGTEFRDRAAEDEDWVFTCADAILRSSACRFQVTRNGVAETIDLPSHRPTATRSYLAQDGIQVLASQGRLAIERIRDPDRPGIAYWPPLDGPRAATSFVGFAQPADDFLLQSHASGGALRVQSLVDPRPVLAEALHLPVGALVEEPRPWGATWARDWIVRGEHRSHPGAGNILLKETAGVGGLNLMSGPVDDASTFSAAVAPLSRDGGLSYDLFLPTGGSGQTLGRYYVFATQGDTAIHAVALGGSAERNWGPLTADSYVVLDTPGLWKIEASRPIVAIWVKRGTDSFGGVAPGLIDSATVTVGAAQYAGYAFDILPDRQVAVARAGDLVEFRIDVANVAKTVTGAGLSAHALFALQAPEGWTDATVAPTAVSLAADGPGSVGQVVVRVRLPRLVDEATGGATLRLVAESQEDPSFTTQQSLRINYVLHRALSVSAAVGGVASDVEAKDDIKGGEVATYDIAITNTGSVRDAYRFEASSPSDAWLQKLSGDGVGQNQTPELAPGASAHYLLEVRLAPDVATAGRLVTHILASSVADRSINDGVRVVTTYATDRRFRVEIEEPSQAVPPGGKAVYRIDVVNEADANQEFRVDVGGLRPSGWPEASVAWVGVGPLVETVDNPDGTTGPTSQVAPLLSLNAGNFGTAVTSADALPTLQATDAPSICRLDVGTQHNLADDAYYVLWAGGTVIDTNSLRLVPSGGDSAGGLVDDSDSAERGKAATSCDPTPQFCFADATGDGYDPLDTAYLTSGGSTDDCLVAPSETGPLHAWSIRLTAAFGRPAGSVVLDQDQDFLSFDLPEKNFGLADAAIGYADKDGSGSPNNGDTFWMLGSAGDEATGPQTGQPGTRPGGKIRLDPGGNLTLLLTRSVPTTAVPLLVGVDLLQLRSSFDPQNLSSFELHTVVDRVVGFDAAFTVPELAVIPESETSGRLRLQSSANVDQVVRIEPVRPTPSAAFSFVDEAGHSPPWDISLKQGATLEVPFKIRASAFSPPTGASPATLEFRLTVSGGAAHHVVAKLNVAERRLLETDGGVLALQPGRLTEVQVPVRNAGNVPLDLSATWTGLPSDWSAAPRSVNLRPAETANLTFAFLVPPSIEGLPQTLKLSFQENGGEALAETEWRPRIGGPSIVLKFASSHLLEGQRVVSVDVLNDGAEPAFNVTVQLETAQGIIDAEVFQQILPGKTVHAGLILPSPQDSYSVRATADHDPEGVLLDVGLPKEVKKSPGVPVFVILLVGIVTVFAHRRSRP